MTDMPNARRRLRYQGGCLCLVGVVYGIALFRAGMKLIRSASSAEAVESLSR